MQEFDYVRVHEISEAVDILSREVDGTYILSGGTDLLVQLRDRQRIARLLIDIKPIPEVNEIKFDPVVGLTLGSAVTCFRIRNDQLVQRIYPGLVDAVSLIGGVQIQGRASVGGNVCNASPAADSIPALIVHNAICIIAGPNGYREMPIENYCIGPGVNALERGELLVSFRIPPPPPRFGAHYLRFTPRNEMDIAVAGAGAAVVLEENMRTIRWSRLALSAVAATPLFVKEVRNYLKGRDISSETFREAARITQNTAVPIQDVRGTVNQRNHLSGVLAHRALERAVERASINQDNP